MSVAGRVFALGPLVLLVVIGCRPAEPAVTSLPATATRIALEPTSTPLLRSAMPASPVAAAVSQAPTAAPTPVPPAVTETPRPTDTPTATATHEPMILGPPLGSEPVTRNAEWTPYIEMFDGVKMALVPAGCFQMGSTDEQVDDAMRQCEEVRGAGNCERGWYEDEQPVAVLRKLRSLRRMAQETKQRIPE